MNKWIARQFALLLALFSLSAGAHDVPASNVLLDIGAYSIAVEIHLPLNELSTAMHLPADQDSAQTLAQHGDAIRTYVDSHVGITTVDGIPYTEYPALLESSHNSNGDWIVAHLVLTPPSAVSTRIFVLDYDVIVADVITHNALVSVRRDFRNALFGNNTFGDDTPSDDTLIIGLMHYQQKHLTVDGSAGSWTRGFGKIFHLGMQHIAEGTDHVLFLLALLLSAPLCAHNRRWVRSASVKTSVWNAFKTIGGFTLGHSLTLVLGAIGVIHFPSQPIEVLIALSILVSAVHAIRPLFANKEPYVAALFGLVHGMAFAGSLVGFNYDSLALMLAVLGFNLGIEAMQLAIVALVLPSLLLMRLSPLYRYLRVAAALATGILASAWLLERAFDLTNLLSGASDALIAHAALAIGILAALAIATRAVEIARRRLAANRRFGANRLSQIDLSDLSNP